ncbi:MAG: aprataxin-like protein [Chrysothrix sp. TS-e1954]|nr:MAG: aprataxin-like protein [Chrysothrix sp. TS-e1954]
MSANYQTPTSGHERSRDKLGTSLAGNDNARLGRDALSSYLSSPEATSLTVSYDDKFVLINDRFPKSHVHMLLMPRSPEATKLHPLTALNDLEFLSLVREKALQARDLLASELRRRFGASSAAEQVRNEELSVDPPPEVLTNGRDWTKVSYSVLSCLTACD